MIQIAIVDDERAFLESYTHIVEKLFAKTELNLLYSAFTKAKSFIIY